MEEDQLPSNNVDAFRAFLTWKANLLNNEGLDLGEQQEDWEAWWTCFLAGWDNCIYYPLEDK